MEEDNQRRTVAFDWETGDFVVDTQGAQKVVTEAEAIEQIAIKALQTLRNRSLIYADIENPESNHTYGSDVQDLLTMPGLPEEIREEELKRAVRETLIYDPWITEVSDITFSTETVVDEAGKAVSATVISLTVSHIFGSTDLEGVTL